MQLYPDLAQRYFLFKITPLHTQYVLSSANCIIEGGSEQIAFVHPYAFIAVRPGDNLTVTPSVSDKFCNGLLTYYLIKSMDIPDLLTYF